MQDVSAVTTGSETSLVWSHHITSSHMGMQQNPGDAGLIES